MTESANIIKDRRITEYIKDFLTPVFEGDKKIRLKFNYNGKSYTTVFTVYHTKEELYVGNKCLNIDIDFSYYFEYVYKTNNFFPFGGEIKSNIGNEPCFTPRLVTDSRSIKTIKRTTSVDVLQILKTKLALAFPIPYLHININDDAKKDGIKISTFNLMRGGDAIYEKYGYKSRTSMAYLKEAIKSVTWDHEFVNTQKSLISSCTGRDNYGPDECIIDILKTVSWDDEKRCQISSKLFEYFFDKFNTTDDVYDDIWIFTLDQNDERWIHSNNELLFTEFTELIEGGRRSKTFKLNRKYKRSTRRIKR